MATEEAKEILLAEYQAVNAAAIDEGQQVLTRHQIFMTVNAIFIPTLVVVIGFLIIYGYTLFGIITLMLVSSIGAFFSFVGIAMFERAVVIYDCWFVRLRQLEDVLKLPQSFHLMDEFVVDPKESTLGKNERIGKKLKGLAMLRSRVFNNSMLWGLLGIWVLVFVFSVVCIIEPEFLKVISQLRT